MKSVHICTIYNRADQYHDMLKSLKAAGFTEDRCRYSGFDNSNHNSFDPYATISRVMASTEEPYIFFCHQDILLNQGHGYDILMARLHQLDELDPNWAVAGNAGISAKYKPVIRITDTGHSPNWKGSWPQLVIALDENLLILRKGMGVHCTASLWGFHFYGPDVCLNALVRGMSCYAIDFHVTHLSKGSFSTEFWEAKQRFEDHWSPQFLFSYYKTVTGKVICLSRYNLLRILGSFRWVSKLLIKINSIKPFLSPSTRQIR